MTENMKQSISDRDCYLYKPICFVNMLICQPICQPFPKTLLTGRKKEKKKKNTLRICTFAIRKPEGIGIFQDIGSVLSNNSILIVLFQKNAAQSVLQARMSN